MVGHAQTQMCTLSIRKSRQDNNGTQTEQSSCMLPPQAVRVCHPLRWRLCAEDKNIMGRRKSKVKAPSRKKYTVPTVFDCPVCHHKQSLTVKMNKAKKNGQLECSVCELKWETKIEQIHDPVRFNKAHACQRSTGLNAEKKKHASRYTH